MSEKKFNKVLVVLNPISGGIEKDKANRLLKELSETYKVEQDIFRTTGEDDVYKLKKKIDEFSPEVVFAGGGDGTINLTARCLLEKKIPMGIIPLGSANGMATELEIPADLEDAYKIAICGEPVEIDIVEVNDQYISLHLSDLGFNANLIKRFEAEEERGKFAYVKQFFKEFAVSKPAKFRFNKDGNKFSKKALMVVFANATMYGTGAIINPLGKLNDNKFEVCIIEPYPWYAIFSIAASLFTGNLDKSKYAKIMSTDFIEVRVKKPQTIQVDGEIVGSYKKVKAKILPDKLSVICPKDLNQVER